jgi:hypothetical protein
MIKDGSPLLDVSGGNMDVMSGIAVKARTIQLELAFKIYVRVYFRVNIAL